MKLYAIKICLLTFMNFMLCMGQDRLHSDLIDGPANIRDKPNGKVLFELFDGVAVTTTEVKNNWYEIGVSFKLWERHRIENKIRKNTYFININGDTIGKAKNDFKFYLWDGGDDQGFIAGYTYVNNIKEELIPEKMLSNLIQIKKFKTKEDFNGFIEDYHFKLYGPHRDLLPEVDMYYISETMLTDITPGFRLSLLFKESYLVGIVHTRPIHIENSVTEELIRGYSLTVINDCLDDLFYKKLKNSIIEFHSKAD